MGNPSPQPPEDKLKSNDEGGRNKELTEFRIKPLLQLVGETQDSTALFMPLQMTDLIGHVTFGDFLRAERNGTLSELKESTYSLYSNEMETVVSDLATSYQNFDTAEKLIAQACQKVNVSPISFKYAKANLSDLIKAIQYLVGDRFAPWPLDTNFKLITFESVQGETSIEQSTSSSEPSDVTSSMTQIPQSNNQSAAVGQGQLNQPGSAAHVILNREQAFHELRKISRFFQKQSHIALSHFYLNVQFVGAT